MSFWAYLILFFAVITGGGIAFYLQRTIRLTLQLVLSFSGAYILGITVLHLMPGVFVSSQKSASLWVLAGFFIQLLLEQLSKGVEHGHIHAHAGANRAFAVQILLGLCIHAFIEGLPLSNYPKFHEQMHSLGDDHTGSNHLLIGVVLHKIPAAFALVMLLLKSGFRPAVTGIGLLIFATMSPLAAFLASLFVVPIDLLVNLVALVVGSFLHIATTILFEADDKRQHTVSWKKMMVIVVGLGLALLTMH